MKKESLSIMTVKTLLAVVIFAGIGTIIIGGGYIIGEYFKNGGDNKIVKPVVQEVVITTDKTEYEQGENIIIAVRNNFDKDIYYYENIYCYLEYQKENGTWVQSWIINMPCLKGEVKRLDSFKSINRTLYFTGNNHIYYSGGGKYRLAFSYGYSNKNTKEKTIYSNEFTIKEKSSLDVRCSEKVKDLSGVNDIDCTVISFGYEFDSVMEKCIMKSVDGCSFQSPFKTLKECQEVCEGKEIGTVLTPNYVLSHSDELIDKTIQVRGVANAGFPSMCTEIACAPDECCNDCSGPLLLVEEGLKRVDKNHAEIVLLGGNCFGNECVLDKCYPLEKGKVYTVTGIWSEKGLSINEEFLFKSEF